MTYTVYAILHPETEAVLWVGYTRYDAQETVQERQFRRLRQELTEILDALPAEPIVRILGHAENERVAGSVKARWRTKLSPGHGGRRQLRSAKY